MILFPGAVAIATSYPNLVVLCLDSTFLNDSAVKFVLRNCHKLSYLSVGHESPDTLFTEPYDWSSILGGREEMLHIGICTTDERFAEANKLKHTWLKITRIRQFCSAFYPDSFPTFNRDCSTIATYLSRQLVEVLGEIN